MLRGSLCGIVLLDDDLGASVALARALEAEEAALREEQSVEEAAAAARAWTEQREEEEEDAALLARVEAFRVRERAEEAQNPGLTEQMIARLPRGPLAPPSPRRRRASTCAATSTAAVAAAADAGVAAEAEAATAAEEEEAAEAASRDCVICQHSMAAGECVTTLPCFHQFHSECIPPWLRANRKCPVCNVRVEVEVDLDMGAAPT